MVKILAVEDESIVAEDIRMTIRLISRIWNGKFNGITIESIPKYTQVA